jgi:hypothetical protein
MRETRSYGSEGGGAQTNGLSLPLSEFRSIVQVFYKSTDYPYHRRGSPNLSGFSA